MVAPVEREVQEITLPGGQTVLAAVSVLRPDQLPDHPAGAPGPDAYGPWDDPEDQDAYDDYDFQDSGALLDTVSARVEQLNELVSGVGSAVLSAARAARPDEVSATFGVEIAVKPGKAVAMLADGQAKGAISVTLTWRAGGSGARPRADSAVFEDDDDPDPEPTDGADGGSAAGG